MSTNPKFPQTTVCRQVTVERNSAGRLVFNYGTPIIEPLILHQSYSLFYKSCPSSTTGVPHYYFGDIFVGPKMKNNDLLDTIMPFSTIDYPLVTEFNQAIRDRFPDLQSFIEKTVAEIEAQPESNGVKDISKYTGLFIHFDFSQVAPIEQWYELKGLIELLDKHEVNILKTEGKEAATFGYVSEVKGYSVNKGFFHTLVSGEDNSDNQFPGFDLSQKYKSFYLTEDQLRCVFYYSKVLKSCQISIPKSAPYCFRLIPVGEYNTQGALDFIDALKAIKSGGLSEDSVSALDSAEAQVTVEQTNQDWDPVELISKMEEKCAKEIISFDLILLRRGGVAAPDVNVGEINNLSRSSLRKNLMEIKTKVNRVREDRKAMTSVTTAFYNIHQNIKKGEKYQIKCTRMMLKLYRGLYFGDPELDKIFLERVQRDIRETGLKSYYGLKTSYMLLKHLSNKGEEVMTRSQELSKQLGRYLAQIMWPLSFIIGRRSRSFEKSQVGLIKSRVGSLPQVVRLLGEYRAKISLHANERLGEGNLTVNTSRAGKAVHDANTCIETMEKEGVKYDRDQLVLGFFDEYDSQCSYAQKCNGN